MLYRSIQPPQNFGLNKREPPKQMAKQQNLHASEAEVERWKRAAKASGLPFNGWARRALSDRADLEFALERQRIRDESGE